MNEFDFIRERLAPLAKAAPGARALTDDAATLALPPGSELVLTADTLIAGVHFREADPLDQAAQKALRANLSDLAAKGADPLGYLLCVSWPRGLPLAERERFVDGLARDQAVYGLPLLGGDTTVGPGPLTVTITALGAAPQGRFVPRSGARPGDAVFVTGTIGDAALGLLALEGGLQGLDPASTDFLARRYLLPEPRLAAAPPLRVLAHAALDVSDGLIADAGHVAETSGARLAIEAEAVPLSPAARAWLDAQKDRTDALVALATGGDDYEVLFCAPEAAGAEVALRSGVAVARIGRVEEGGAGVALLGRDGAAIPVARAGYTHF